MSSYLIFCIKSVHDERAMAEYRRAALPQMQAQQLKFFAGPSVETVLEGESLSACVVLEFADREAALRWYRSPEYQELAKIRQSASDGAAFIVDSWPLASH